MQPDYELDQEVERAVEESVREFFQIVSFLSYLHPYDRIKEQLEQKYDDFAKLREKGMLGRCDLEHLRWDAITPEPVIPDQTYERILASFLQKLPPQQPAKVRDDTEKLSLEELVRLGKDYVRDVARYALKEFPDYAVEPKILIAACWVYYERKQELKRLDEQETLILDYFADQLIEFNASEKGTAYAGQGLYILLDFYDFINRKDQELPS